MSHRSSALWISAALLALLSSACAGDPGGSSGGDDNDASLDGSGGDVSADAAVCAPTEPPADGDLCDCEAETFEGRVSECDRACVCEFGFWECADDCDTVLPLELRWATRPRLSELTGNGDTLLEPGETWAVTGEVAATNAPSGGASVTVRITSTSPSIDTDGSSISLADVGEAAAAFELPFLIDARAPALPFELRVEAFSGFASLEETIDATVSVADAPELSWSDVELLTETGTLPIRIDAGGSYVASATLRNSGTATAQGVEVSLAPSSGALVVGEPVVVGILAAGATRAIEIPVTVDADPSDLEPTLTFAAEADNAEIEVEVLPVTVVPPDRVVFVSQAWRNAGGEAWELVVTLRNDGRVALSGLAWSRVEYVSPDPSDDPYIPEAMGIGEPVGPASLAAGASVEVTMPLAVTGETPDRGRVFLQLTSSRRRHGPYALDVERPSR